MSVQTTSVRLFACAALALFMLTFGMTGTAVAQIPYQIRIDSLSGVTIGSNISIPVIKEAGSIAMAGFDLVIRYDTLGMDLVDVTPGSIFTTPGGWEYFDYRNEIIGDSASGIPAGWLRIIGLYDMPNDSTPTTPEIPDGTILFTLNFAVSTNSSLDCYLFPLRFYWLDCSDNSISNMAGTVLYISDHVYDFTGIEMTDVNFGFPGESGAPDECLVPGQPENPLRYIDFYDGFVEIECSQTDTTAFRIEIGTYQSAMFGQNVLVPVTKAAGTELMDGFDILIGYDGNILTLLEATPGPIFEDPNGWEYFSYRTSTSECAPACPSQVVSVVALYHNTTANDPTNQAVANGTPLFNLNFFVNYIYNYECTFNPIDFFWMDCGDNAIAFEGGNTLALSNHVYNVFLEDITDTSASFPTYNGSPAECFINPGDPVRLIDYANGGVDIICDGPIDNRGDINLNGIAYEIADYIVFTNYFLYGLPAFIINVEAQIAATDINADGLPLTVNDLIYLIRVVEGAALPYPMPDKAETFDFAGNLTIFQAGSMTTIHADFEDSVGGVFLSFSAPDIESEDDYTINVSPQIANMDVAYNASGGKLNILITKLRTSDSISATIPAGPVNLLTITYTGSEPTLSQAAACGYMGEYVDLTTSVYNYLCGDANGDGSINILDIIYIIAYLYRGGSAPDPVGKADLNGDGNVNLMDVTYFIQYLYRSGSAPQCN
ncbi:MAG: dockerin type I domain-containing protein [Candidatus Zixiibacteriota bacterium]